MIDIEKSTFKALSDFINECTGKRPYLMDEDFIRPKNPFVGCKMVGIDPVSEYAHYGEVDANGYTELAMHFILRWHIQAYKDNAIDTLAQIIYRLSDKNISHLLNNAGMAYKGKSRMMNTPMTRDGIERERQATVVVDFHYTYYDSKHLGLPPSTIETVGGFVMEQGNT